MMNMSYASISLILRMALLSLPINDSMNDDDNDFMITVCFGCHV